jgi:hypothetical protein
MMATDPTPDLAAIRAAVDRLRAIKNVAWRGRNDIDEQTLLLGATVEQSQDVHTVMRAVPSLLEYIDAQAARLTAVEQALETIRDYDALDTPIRPGPCSIGDMSLAISRGLDYCQRVASAALKGAADGR